MIDRYIYAVTRELPEKSRKKVASELKALIDDMMHEKDDALSEEERIAEVLLELGNPRELANRYRGKERYLIGPKYFYKYLFVMKIVMISIVIGISVVSGLGAIFSTESIAEVASGYLFTLFSAVLQGAAWVTGIFALLEYNEISVETEKEQGVWEPSQLAALKNEKALISRGESIFSIIISTLFLLLFFFLYEKIGIYYRVDGEFSFIPLFNIEGVTELKLIVFLIFTINILVELIKIIKGRWTLKIAAITALLNVISAALFINVIYNMDIWSSEFVQRFEEYMPISFERMIVVTIVVIIIVTIGESLSALYKGFRYG
ncbi:HAAS signaling domain-containing protein [Alkalibacterium sp. f15]|uniref:HAAS signaling domain-containing protein n=1 Tax=Alkalibacterium sp. f15 TaxID=3414029 RepID=UPI003BF8D56B